MVARLAIGRCTTEFIRSADLAPGTVLVGLASARLAVVELRISEAPEDGNSEAQPHDKAHFGMPWTQGTGGRNHQKVPLSQSPAEPDMSIGLIATSDRDVARLERQPK